MRGKRYSIDILAVDFLMVWDEDESESEQPPRRALIRRHSVRLLQQSHCHSKDNVEHLIYKLVNGGSEKLQLITTFDHTLTRGNAPNTFKMLLESSVWPDTLVDDLNMLPGKIEDNLQGIRKLLQGVKLREAPSSLITQMTTSLRDYAKEFLEHLSHRHVPLLLYSPCGLGDCIASLIQQANYKYDNIHVIEDSLECQDDLLLKGLKPKPNQMILKGNVVLLGSKLEDVQLINGILPQVKTVLKIGFLNEQVEQNLSKFMEAYDMVLVNDPSLDVPLALVELIEKSKQL